MCKMVSYPSLSHSKFKSLTANLRVLAKAGLSSGFVGCERMSVRPVAFVAPSFAVRRCDPEFPIKSLKISFVGSVTSARQAARDL